MYLKVEMFWSGFRLNPFPWAYRPAGEDLEGGEVGR